MASAMDSGVETGNDSNDSFAQEKLSKMDLGNENNQQAKSQDSGKENSSEEEQELVAPSQTTLEPPDRKDPGPGISVTHLQPLSLMYGYEYRPTASTPSGEVHHRKLSCLMFNVKDIGGVFVSGGPLGTEYQESEVVTRLRRRTLSGSHLRKCLRSANYSSRITDTMRMCRAACHNNTQAMREMLERGMSPNVHDGYKRTPLHLAACMGFADMVKMLLDYGADPNAKDSIGNSPLHLAACTNHVAVITLLLKAGTRVTERDMAGHSPLQLAITKFNIIKRSVMPHPQLKEQVCQVIAMLTEYMRRKEGPAVDPELLNKFESLVRVSDSTEQVESNIRDLLTNLNSLSLDES